MAFTTNLSVCKLAAVWLGCDPDSLVDVESVSSSSSKEDTLFNLIYDQSRIAAIELRNWPFAIRDIQLNLAQGTDEANWNSVTVGGITAADPAVVTANNHGFLDGWNIKISDVSGMTEINDLVVRVASKNNNTFECYQLDSRKFTAYSSGGNAIRYEIISDYQDGYTYEAPDDILRGIATLPVGSQYEIVGSGNSKRLLSPESSLSLQYLADISTVSEMSTEFIRCWAAKMAAELAAPLQKKASIRDDMWEWYQVVLNESGLSAARNADIGSLIRESSPSLDAGGWE